MYWQAKEELLVQQWKQADTAEQFRIYAAMDKPLRHMVTVIQNRYFNYNPNYETIRQDCINHLYLQLHKFDPQRGKTAYAFCQTIIKNYFITELVHKPQRSNYPQIEYRENLSAYHETISYQYQYPEANGEIKAKFLIKTNEIIAELNASIAEIKKRKTRKNHGHAIRFIEDQIVMMEAAKQFLTKFKGLPITHAEMLEYIYYNTDMGQNRVGTFMKKYFGKGGAVLYKNNREVRSDNKGWTMYNDDHVPSSSYREISDYRLKLKTIDNTNNYNYF